MYIARIKLLLMTVFLLGGLLSQLSFKWFLVLMVPIIVMGVIDVDEKTYEVRKGGL